MSLLVTKSVNMTSEVEALKTNEFLRRRKLRLQQVREQSKDIAKQIRQRAKVEKLRHLGHLDSKKENQHIQRQEKLVKYLEQLHDSGIKNVGASHSKASEVTLLDEVPVNVDLSKLRGKEAVHLLRQAKQQKLDDQKKVLQRKLQARETANLLSRDKSKSVTNQLQHKKLESKSNNAVNKDSGPHLDNAADDNSKGDNVKEPVSVTKSDMATQWVYEGVPTEWDPTAKKAEEEKVASKDSAVSNIQLNAEKYKKPNLFAVSEDMPYSSRTVPSSMLQHQQNSHLKSSLTLVSEYLQRRHLNLRAPNIAKSCKEDDDLESIKRTISRSKCLNTAGNTVCIVHDEQVIPVPSWLPEACAFCPDEDDSKTQIPTRKENEKNNDSIGVCPRPVMRGSSPFRRNNVYMKMQDQTTKDKFIKINLPESGMNTKNSEASGVSKTPLTVYNHSTRDSRHILGGEDNLVLRDEGTDEDAYSQAFRENEHKIKMQETPKKYQEMRHKVAVTKQTIEKEYKDTLEFLKSLPKDKQSSSIKRAFMTDQRQQSVLDHHQREMQKAFQKIQIENKRNQNNDNKQRTNRSKSNSPPNECEDESETQDLRYSWMPVPERDSSLAIHTIPVTMKDSKSSKEVKFSEVDSYHEYRSRHRHTPPTKDTGPVKKIIIEKNTTEESSSETNSVISIPTEDLLDEQLEKSRKLSDAEGVIIYKIIDSKTHMLRRKKKHSERKSGKKKLEVDRPSEKVKKPHEAAKSTMSAVEQLHEGVYKRVSERDSISSLNYDSLKKTSTQVVTGIKGLHWNADDKSEQEVPIRNETQSCSATCQCGCVNAQISDTSTNMHSAHSANKLNKDAGFIKVVNQDGIESGKLFIGTPNFLNSDSYEVVIQLRKKDAAKNDKDAAKNDKDAAKNDKDAAKNDKESARECMVDEKSNIGEQVSNVKITGSQSKYVTPAVSPHSSEREISTHVAQPQEPEGSTTRDQQETQSQPERQLTETAVQPSSVHVETVRPSTSTQTSFNSSMRRPLLNHPSSSASTSYMSPPDKILPLYINADFGNDTPKKEDSEKRVQRKVCRKSKYERKNDDIMARKERSVPTERHHSPKPVIPQKDPRHPKRYREPYRRGTHKQAYESYQMLTRRPVRNQCKGRQSNSKLNPVVQNYVKKLLTLSKESLKAIEVNNQDCSSVTTPSGSVINIPSNYDKRKKDVDFKISLGQIKDMLQQLIIENSTKSVSQKSGAKYVINGRKKVKPIFISKTFKTSSDSQDKQPECNQQKVSSSSSVSSKSSPSTDKIPFVAMPKKSSTVPNNKTETKDKKSALSNTTTHDSAKVQTSRRIHTPKSMSCGRDSAETSSSENHDSVNKNTKACSRPIPKKNQDITTISTQTLPSVDGDIIKLTETKIQNMEKIADLTEKCTNRLSNLAKVLQEVRQYKSTAYSHISTSDSSTEDLKSNKKSASKTIIPSSIKNDAKQKDALKPLPSSEDKAFIDSIQPSPVLQETTKSSELRTTMRSPKCDKMNLDMKIRRKPPAVASLLKHEFVAPHELSTVVEVDSPISVLSKSKPLQTDCKSMSSVGSSPKSENGKESKRIESSCPENSSPPPTMNVNPDLLDMKMPIPHVEAAAGQGQGDMMDIQKFKEIILKPFVSIEEYAKQCNISILNDKSKIKDITKEIMSPNDDLSSLHSEGSLPDVIGELLKRKVISKPFEFESVSNINSTTISTESSLSGLALSKIPKENKIPNLGLESSDSLSLSSNAELENAFKNLGMNWASSTLKKTKERLALSSSSNTSNSSVSQKYKPSVTKNEIVPNDANPSKKSSYIKDHEKSLTMTQQSSLKSVNQQTSMGSLTVRQFLDKELANKITFSKSQDESEPEFISMFETKMPDTMKDVSVMREGHSIDDVANQVRPRTSTPVQLFKCATYNSSDSISSHNRSNELFLDDLSSVKVTSGGSGHHTTSDKDDLTIPNYSLKLRKH